MLRKHGIFTGALVGAGLGATAYKDDPRTGILGGAAIGAGLQSMFSGTAFPTIGGALLGGYLGKKYLPEDETLGMLGGGLLGAGAGHALFGKKPFQAVKESLAAGGLKPWVLPAIAGVGLGYLLWDTLSNRSKPVMGYPPPAYPPAYHPPMYRPY
jgi:hypothetical protein